jgi:hypothetical protein
MERYEEARAFVVEYHANGNADHPIVALEMEEMKASMREQGILSWRNYFDIRVLYKSRSRRYGMMLKIAMSWFGQFSGKVFAILDFVRWQIRNEDNILIIFKEQHCIVLSSIIGCKRRYHRSSRGPSTQRSICSYRMDRGWYWSSSPRRSWSSENVAWKV